MLDWCNPHLFPDACARALSLSLLDYVAMTDLKGKIPGYIKDKVAQSQPMDLARLRKIAEAEHPQLLAQLDIGTIPTPHTTGPVVTIEATPAAAPKPVAELDLSRVGESRPASNESMFSASGDPADRGADTPVPTPTPRHTTATATTASVLTASVRASRNGSQPPAGTEHGATCPRPGAQLADDGIPSKPTEAAMAAVGKLLDLCLLVFVWSLIVILVLYYVNFEMLLLPAFEAFAHAAAATTVLVIGGSLFWTRPPT